MSKQVQKQGGKDNKKKTELSEKVKNTLSEQELQEFKDIFNLFDLDKSGTIDTEEVANAMNNQGLHERNPVLYEVISSLCEVGGQIDENTFIETICDKLGNIKTREGINRLFELYVTDQGEEINFDIIKRVSHELGETLNDDELKEMMHHVHILNKCGTQDPDGNVTFNQDDFYQILTRDRSSIRAKANAQ